MPYCIARTLILRGRCHDLPWCAGLRRRKTTVCDLPRVLWRSQSGRAVVLLCCAGRAVAHFAPPAAVVRRPAQRRLVRRSLPGVWRLLQALAHRRRAVWCFGLWQGPLKWFEWAAPASGRRFVADCSAAGADDIDGAYRLCRQRRCGVPADCSRRLGDGRPATGSMYVRVGRSQRSAAGSR